MTQDTDTAAEGTQAHECTALVTGGTDGIGKEVARGLAAVGTRVFIVGRDPEKGARTADELRSTTSYGDVYFIRADLSLMREAGRLADEVRRRVGALHYLVHSAGILRGRRVLTAEGVESNFAVNYLSRFVLTTRLLASLRAGAEPRHASRIVVIGGGATGGTIHFDDVNLSRNFTTVRAILQYQQANDMLTLELARQLAMAEGAPEVSITCLKLGPVKTNIRREFPWWMRVLVPLIADPLVTLTPHQAAASVLRLLLAPELEGVTGALFKQIRKFHQIVPTGRTRDPQLARRLWELSERLAEPRTTSFVSPYSLAGCVAS